MNKISITHISNEHSDWLRSLNFYKQEIGILKERLTEIAGKNSHIDVLKQVEHFENQFKLQTDNTQRLMRDIKANLKSIAKEAEAAKAGYVDGILAEQHKAMGQQYETEQKIINELRHSFNQFSAEWM
jgi:hypothetical protein